MQTSFPNICPGAQARTPKMAPFSPAAWKERMAALEEKFGSRDAAWKAHEAEHDALKPLGWYKEHPEDLDDVEEMCVFCGCMTQPVLCDICGHCDAVNACVDCIVEKNRKPSCLEHLDEAVRAANARVPILLEAIKADASVTEFVLHESFEACDDDDLKVWVKFLVCRWKPQPILFVAQVQKCAACKGTGPGISYGLGLGREEAQCLPCIIQKCLLRSGYYLYGKYDLTEVEVNGQNQVALFDEPTTKAPR